MLHGDIKIRSYVKKKLALAAVSKIIIERAWNSIRVTIHTARPGLVIGRKGAEIETMTKEISQMAGGKQVKIDIYEIKTPEIEASSSPRTSRFSSSAVSVPPRHEEGGEDGHHGDRRGRHPLHARPTRWRGNRARREWKDGKGRVPLHTLRANIDYGSEAKTLIVTIGVKCWICKRGRYTDRESRIRSPAEAAWPDPFPNPRSIMEITSWPISPTE